MTFTLDSNIWERAVAPEDFQDDPNYNGFLELNHFLKSKTDNQFFIHSSIFDLEAIRRKDRLNTFSGIKPKTTTVQDGNKTSITISIDDSFSIPENPYLRKRAVEAFNLGIRVTDMPRVGMPRNPIYSEHMCFGDEEQLELMFEVETYIENELDAGIAALKNKLISHGLPFTDSLIQDVKTLFNNKVKGFDKVVGEWADGDSIATHIGMGFDYFVTLDNAATAGTHSVMYKDNIKKLKSKYKLNKITLEECLNLLRRG